MRAPRGERGVTISLTATGNKRPGRIFMDMFISSVIGAGVVLLVLRPESVSEACNAGLGLGGILSAFGKDV